LQGRIVIVLVLGGVRSGKSEVAEQITTQIADNGPITYLATGVATDPVMAQRIETHRARRPATWATIEAGHDLAGVLETATGTVLVDALGTWVAHTDDFAVDAPTLCRALTDRTGSTVVVSDEVGLSVHAPTDAGRRFADALGDLNRAVADVADRTLFVAAGRATELFDVARVLGTAR
jgi:adenosyl cobinamide kinase/adenosyl cobinamide phosphate guanylyltransferase